MKTKNVSNESCTLSIFLHHKIIDYTGCPIIFLRATQLYYYSKFFYILKYLTIAVNAILFFAKIVIVIVSWEAFRYISKTYLL